MIETITRKEAIRELERINNITINGFEYYKTDNILRKLENVKVEVRDRMIYDNAQTIGSLNMESEALEICKLHNITMDQLKKKNRSYIYVCARVHFCRTLRIKYLNLPLLKISQFLNQHHSTTIHYLYYSKVECPIAPLPLKQIRYE